MHFYPRPPRGGRPGKPCCTLSYGEFLSTPSARRATAHVGFRHRRIVISIHALREEGDRSRCILYASAYHFYPRPPRGGRQTVCHPERMRRFISIHALREEGDSIDRVDCSSCGHFYPRPPRGGRRDAGPFQLIGQCISIHALREEGDRSWHSCLSAPARISIHALREEGDIYLLRLVAVLLTISIHALREEGDETLLGAKRKATHFYPRPPRGGRPRA